MKQRKGFTLIELLIVIALIGSLAVLGMSSFVNSQRRGRDARRVSDLKSIQFAMESYYAENGSYPDGTCTTVGTFYFPQGFPKDPRTQVNYAPHACATDSYCFCVTMESATGNANALDCTSFTPGNAQCVRNLQ